MELLARSYGGDHNFEFLDDLDTRGGPPIVKPARDFYNFNISTDSRKRWGLGFFVFGNHDAARRVGAKHRHEPPAAAVRPASGERQR